VKDVFFSLRMLVLAPKADICVTNAFWLPALVAAFRPGAGRVVMNVQRVPKGQMWLYDRVQRLSAVSTAIAETIVAQRPSLSAAVRVIPNPVDLGFFEPPVQRELRPGTAGRTILFTGRIHPEKGLHLLVEAFTRLYGEFPDLKLRLVGPSTVDRGGGGLEYLTQLRALAGGTPVTIDAPIYDRGQLALALQTASFYCYPTLAEQGEAQPVAPMEAMATGLVPVVSTIPQFRDYLTDGVDGICFDHRSADRVDHLCKALRSLIADPDKAKRMGDLAAVGARRFGYDQVAEMYLSDFQSLLSVQP